MQTPDIAEILSVAQYGNWTTILGYDYITNIFFPVIGAPTLAPTSPSVGFRSHTPLEQHD